MEIHIQNRKKGFTLAELLVVVAIVAILAAISIPIFTRQLEASREATDLAILLFSASALQPSLHSLYPQS